MTRLEIDFNVVRYAWRSCRTRRATEADVAFFAEHGWIAVADAIDPADLVDLEEQCQKIIDNKESMAFDWAWEEGTDRDQREFKIVQSSPSLFWQALRRRAVPPLGRGVRLRADGRRPLEFWYDQFLAKPPHKSVATRWHQDEGYWGRNLDDRGITCWMPFHDVDASNGCMHFIDGGHRDGVLEHRNPAEIAERPPRAASPTSRASVAVPARGRRRHVPPQQDAAHDDAQRHRLVAPHPHAAPARGRRTPRRATTTRGRST